MTHWRIIQFVFAIVLVSMPAWAVSPEILEAAKQESEVVRYTTMPIGEFQIFNQAAKEKYPFLTIRHVRINSGSQAARVMQASGVGAAAHGFLSLRRGIAGTGRAGKIPARRGVKSPSEEIDRLLDSANLHVLKNEGEYGRSM